MKKLLMSVDPESHDDVAGLFNRLGRRDASGHYQDFSSSRQQAETVAEAVALVVPPALPAVDVVSPTPLPPLPSAITATVQAVTTTAQASDRHAGTSLRALFQRLADAPLDASAGSPLARLRQR